MNASGTATGAIKSALIPWDLLFALVILDTR